MFDSVQTVPDAIFNITDMQTLKRAHIQEKYTGFLTSERHHMKTNLRTKIAASIMIMGLGFAGAVNAQVTLPPGSTVFNTGGVLATSLGSFTLLASMSTPFTAANPTAFSGVLDSFVLSGNTDNPLGGLSFLYRVSNSQASNDAIHRLAVNGFGGLPVQAGYLSSGVAPTGGAIGALGVTPTLVDRGIAPGDNIGFSFLAGTISGLTFESINPGERSSYVLVYTNATTYGGSIASVIDGSVASAATFAPVPEPETYAMMLAGLGLMGFVARRRSKKDVN